MFHNVSQWIMENWFGNCRLQMEESKGILGYLNEIWASDLWIKSPVIYSQMGYPALVWTLGSDP